jgi:hypothetical protein
MTQGYVVCELPEKLNILWGFIKTHLKVSVTKSRQALACGSDHGQ